MGANAMLHPAPACPYMLRAGSGGELRCAGPELAAAATGTPPQCHVNKRTEKRRQAAAEPGRRAPPEGSSGGRPPWQQHVAGRAVSGFWRSPLEQPTRSLVSFLGNFFCTIAIQSGLSSCRRSTRHSAHSMGGAAQAPQLPPSPRQPGRLGICPEQAARALMPGAGGANAASQQRERYTACACSPSLIHEPPGTRAHGTTARTPCLPAATYLPPS